MQLADAEPVSVHHEHHGRVGNVDTDLDDCGAHQDIDLPGPEGGHHRVLLVGRQPPVHQAEPQPGKRILSQVVEQLEDGGGRRAARIVIAGVGLVDTRRDDVGLPAGPDLLDDALPGAVQPRRLLLDEDRAGGDRLTAAGQLAQRRRLQISVNGERDRSRNRRCGHHQQVRRQTGRGLGAQPISLLDAEPVLFVDHHHAEPLEFDGVLQQRVGADHNAGFPGRDLIAHLSFLLRRHRTRQQGHPGRALVTAELTRHRQRTEHVTDRPGMLGGKDFRGSEQCALVAGIDHLQHRQHRNDRLARADLTLQHPVHRAGRGQFGRQHVEHFALAVGQLERQLTQQRREQSVVPTWRGWTGFAQLPVTPRHQRPLQSHSLVDGEPLAGTVPLYRVLGDVNRPQRLVFRDQAPLAHNRFRQRLFDRVKQVKHLPHTRIDVPALHLGAGGVDRKELALECRQQLLAGFP